MSRKRWVWIWGAVTAVVVLVTVWPPEGYAAHVHWDRVAWVPFADPDGKSWELAGNVLLFAPLGYAGARALGGSRRACILAAVGGVALSFAVESAQLFAHGRFPSATDWVANSLGTVLGASAARQRSG